MHCIAIAVCYYSLHEKQCKFEIAFHFGSVMFIYFIFTHSVPFAGLLLQVFFFNWRYSLLTFKKTVTQGANFFFLAFPRGVFGNLNSRGKCSKPTLHVNIGMHVGWPRHFKFVCKDGCSGNPTI